MAISKNLKPCLHCFYCGQGIRKNPKNILFVKSFNGRIIGYLCKQCSYNDFEYLS